MTSMSKRKLERWTGRTLGLAAVLMIGGAIVAHAWDQPAQQQPPAAQQQQPAEQDIRMEPQQAPAQADVSDADLAKAARVYQALSAMNMQLQQELEGVSDHEEIQQRVAETEHAMHQVVVGEGMQIEEYNEIMQRIQVDRDLQDRFRQQMQ